MGELTPIVLDAETFYDTKTKYSLRSMTVREYVSDSRFRDFCWGVCLPDSGETYRMTQPEFNLFARDTDWSKLRVVAHNAFFDGYILEHKYGARPGAYFCTMDASKAILGGVVKNFAMGTIAKYLGLRGKLDDGKALADMDGVREPTDAQMNELLLYAGQDAEEEADLFRYLSAKLPYHEWSVLSWTIEMYVRAKMLVNADTIDEGIQEVRDERAALLDAIPITATTLRSGPKFADHLRTLGVEPPVKETTKFDKTAGKRVKAQTYAFAKDDFEFIEMGADPKLEPYVKAKLAYASNQEATRLETMLKLAESGDRAPVPLHYSGAKTTHRFSGFDGMNFQNLGRNSKCRTALEAPEGHKLVIRDSSGIEMRVMNCLAGGWDALQRSYEKQDEYSLFAGNIYNRPIDKHRDPTERKVGKVSVLSCIAVSSMVDIMRPRNRLGVPIMADNDLIAYRTEIQDVQMYDKIACVDAAGQITYKKHRGVVHQGAKQVVRYGPLRATLDHEVYVYKRHPGDPTKLMPEMELITFAEAIATGRTLVSALKFRSGGGSLASAQLKEETYARIARESDGEHGWEDLGIMQVYDILDVGYEDGDAAPHNFFASGCLVHNCGYGSGAKTYQKMLFNQAGIIKPLDFCQTVVNTYRDFYHEMPAFWKWVDDQLEKLIDGIEPEPFRWGAPLEWISEYNEFGDKKIGFRSALGMEVKWWNLRREYVDWGDGNKMQIVYDMRDKNIPGVGAIKTLWGGTGLENMSQFMAREIITYQALQVWLRTGIWPSMHVHDEHIWVVPDAQVEEFDAIAAEEMSGPVPFWPKLITDSAGEISRVYTKPD